MIVDPSLPRMPGPSANGRRSAGIDRVTRPRARASRIDLGVALDPEARTGEVAIDDVGRAVPGDHVEELVDDARVLLGLGTLVGDEHRRGRPDHLDARGALQLEPPQLAGRREAQTRVGAGVAQQRDLEDLVAAVAADEERRLRHLIALVLPGVLVGLGGDQRQGARGHAAIDLARRIVGEVAVELVGALDRTHRVGAAVDHGHDPVVVEHELTALEDPLGLQVDLGDQLTARERAVHAGRDVRVAHGADLGVAVGLATTGGLARAAVVTRIDRIVPGAGQRQPARHRNHVARRSTERGAVAATRDDR
ncbi:MAG: hypothetical protein IAG13_31450, partial [Deltaproteobacteria bacterium]|nr:hypothetical protein [Nannocystaceae bacterium]